VLDIGTVIIVHSSLTIDFLMADGLSLNVIRSRSCSILFIKIDYRSILVEMTKILLPAKV